MTEKKERGNYLSLILMIIFITVVPVLIGVFFEDRLSEDTIVRLILILCTFFIWFLGAYIRRTQRLYWVNMYSFKRVKEMDEALIELLCDSFYNAFTIFSLIIGLLIIVFAILSFPIWFDIIVFTALTVLMALKATYDMFRIEKDYKK